MGKRCLGLPTPRGRHLKKSNEINSLGCLERPTPLRRRGQTLRLEMRRRELVAIQQRVKVRPVALRKFGSLGH